MLLPVLGFLFGCSAETAVTAVVKCAKVVDVEYVAERYLGLPTASPNIIVYLVLSDGSRQLYGRDGFSSDAGYAKAYPVQFKHGYLGVEICPVEFVKK